jgi:hypothetical protein
MKWHLRYWLAKIRNDFLRLFWLGPTGDQCATEIMAGLKRDPGLREAIERAAAEEESERTAN